MYVVSHGWHTGIVLFREDLIQVIPDLAQRFPAGEYLEIGWGDSGFYQAREITTGITLRAIFWPSDSVVHVVSVPRSPFVSFPDSEIHSLGISDRNLGNAVAYIAESFSRDPEGRLEPIKNGIYGDSQFYEGKGHYHLFNTCNKWTAKVLRRAGLDINPLFSLTASSVMNAIEKPQITRKEAPEDR